MSAEALPYAAFWDQVGDTFPSLKGAASTAYYAACERWLCARYFPPLAGRRLLKTDLWDEAKNTEILRWAAERGARPVGVDIAWNIAREATDVLAAHEPLVAVADVRALPFLDTSIDCIYSMGTIEHFPDYAAAVSELYRVLRPGGTAIVGVPNLLDPFLRPLLVDALNRLGLYAYGREKAFTPDGLRSLLEVAGFRVVAQSGILFMPGWLRMLDLVCHTRGWPLARPTAALVAPFAALYTHLPAVRRHGYLIAAVARKPVRPSHNDPARRPDSLPDRLAGTRSPMVAVQ